MDHGTIRLPNDSSWKWAFIKGVKDSINDSYTGTAHFKKVSELNRYFLLPADSMPGISIKADCKRKFRWFYTYIDYSETYQKLLPLNKVPVSDYLTKEEAVLATSDEGNLIYFPAEDLLRVKKDSSENNILSHEDSLKMTAKLKGLEEKFNAWLASAIFEEVYNIFLEKAASANDPINLKEGLKTKKDTIKAWWTSKKIELDDFEHGHDLKFWTDSILIIAGHSMPISDNNRQLLNDTTRINSIEEKVMEAWGLTDDRYTNNVIMPGLIMKTNATILNGNMVSWKVESENFFLYDYTMEVESRIVNRWVFWLTGILIIGFGVLLLFGGWKKSRSR
jgi:hypothetical protein